MLNTAQRLFNYITQNEKDGRSKPDLITRRQARRIKKKARRGEAHTVVVEIETSDKAECQDKWDSDLAETFEDFGPVPHPDDVIASLKVSELRSLAKEKGLKGYSTLKKAELVSLIQGE